MTATLMLDSAGRPGGRRLVAALLSAALLAGCGQKGPLWVPGHAKNTPWPMKPAGADTASPATPDPAKPAGDGKTPAPQGPQ